jgi:hypothetical protein
MSTSKEIPRQRQENVRSLAHAAFWKILDAYRIATARRSKHKAGSQHSFTPLGSRQLAFGGHYQNTKIVNP